MKKKILLFSVYSLLLIGCKEQSSNNSITCISSLNLNEARSLSSVFPNSRIIQLETTDESLIGQDIHKIRKRNNKFHISFDRRAISIFDEQGKFINRIERRGGGPGEYIELRDFDVLSCGSIVVLDVRKLIFYSSTGEFIREIPLEIAGLNLRAVDDNHFLIRATNRDYCIYLINCSGEILLKQLERRNRRIVGRPLVFYILGYDQIIFQQYFSNNFLSFNVTTKEFTHINLLCDEDRILNIERVHRHQRRHNNNNFVDNNPNARIISNIASYSDYLLFFAGSQNTEFRGYLMNTANNSVTYIITQNTVDDIGFTQLLLLNSIGISDFKESFVTFLHPFEIAEGLNNNNNAHLRDHPNYQRLRTLLAGIDNIYDENPVLVILRR